MRKWGVILLATLLIAIVAAVLWQTQKPREPLYQGKTVTHLLRHPKTVTYYPRPAPGAAPGIKFFSLDYQLMDSNAVPSIIKNLQTKDNIFDKSYAALWPKLPSSIQSRLSRPVPASVIRAQSATSLGWVGRGSEPAMLALIQTMKNDDSPDVRLAAGFSLIQFSGTNKMLVQAWIDAAKDPSPLVSQFASGVVGQLVHSEYLTKPTN